MFTNTPRMAGLSKSTCELQTSRIIENNENSHHFRLGLPVRYECPLVRTCTQCKVKPYTVLASSGKCDWQRRVAHRWTTQTSASVREFFWLYEWIRSISYFICTFEDFMFNFGFFFSFCLIVCLYVCTCCYVISFRGRWSRSFAMDTNVTTFVGSFSSIYKSLYFLYKLSKKVIIYIRTNFFYIKTCLKTLCILNLIPN